MRVDISLDSDTDQLLNGVESALTHCAGALDRIDQDLLEIKRILLDTARTYRKALRSGAALHIADGADVVGDESADD